MICTIAGEREGGTKNREGGKIASHFSNSGIPTDEERRPEVRIKKI